MQISLWLRRHLFLVLALLALLISSFWGLPDLRVVDWSVILLLFNLMLVIHGLIDSNLLNYLASRMLRHCSDERSLASTLSGLCFVFSMLITNDITLILFVPLTLLMLERITIDGSQIIVLETLAANLGSSFTPLGNPQNLFIYSYFKYSVADFLVHSFPLLVLGGLFLFILIKRVPPTGFRVQLDLPVINRRQSLIFGSLFCLVLLGFLGWISYSWITLMVIVVSIIYQPRQLLKIDYPLLMLFIVFFLLIGNLIKFPELITNIHYALNFPAADYWLGLGLSQVISNVSAVFLLAPVNRSPQLLLWGVNVGGMGTLIASMASMISYRLYIAKFPQNKLSYLSRFFRYNFAGIVFFSIVLSCLAFIMRYLALLNF